MNAELEKSSLSKSLAAAVSKPSVNGVICIDANGLLIAGKGQDIF